MAHPQELAEAAAPIVVLLVGHSAVIRALVRRMLVPAATSWSEAAAAAALALCREQQPHVVLLDVEMPEMSGWDGSPQ